MQKAKNEIRTLSDKNIEEITLKTVMEDNVSAEDFRITSSALKYQAQVAEKAGRKQLAENFRRATELTVIPDNEVVKIYNALRPGRSTRDELLQLIHQLEEQYKAPRNAALVKETLEVYEKRRLLKT